MREIKRIGIISVVKYQTFLSVVYMAVFGLPFVLLGSAFDASVSIILYVTALIFAPLVVAITTALSVLLYNLTAGFIGGIEVDLAPEESDVQDPVE